jgi:hypothetical protein
MNKTHSSNIKNDPRFSCYDGNGFFRNSLFLKVQLGLPGDIPFEIVDVLLAGDGGKWHFNWSRTSLARD